MIKKFMCGAFAMLAALSAVNAQAFTAVTDSDSKTVFITGELCGNSQKAFLTVVRPGADIDNLTDYNAEIAYISDVGASLTGQLGATIPLPRDAQYGQYTLNINDGCGLSGHRAAFDFTDDRSLLSELNGILSDSGKSAADYESFMAANGSAFGINIADSGYIANRENVWSAIKSGAPYAAKTDVFRVFGTVLSLSELNRAGNAAEKQGALEKCLIYLNDSEATDRYNQLKPELMQNFCSIILNNRYEYSTGAEAIKADLLVGIVNQADREHIKAVIEKYYATIGIDISPQSDFAKLENPQNVYIGLANKKDFKSLAEIKEYFNELVLSPAQPGGAGGNSPSSGGGGGGGSVGVSVKVQPNADVSVSNAPQYFNDLGSVEWAAASINRLYEKSIISGVGADRFEPEGYVTREEFLKMAVNAFNVKKRDDAEAVAMFEDVAAQDWYFPYIETAVSAGIVNGINDVTFGIGEKITRQDMCVMLYRCMREKGAMIKSSADESGFADFGECAEYSREAVSILSANSIINGVGENVFAPYEFATRAMAAVIIDRALNEAY